MDIDFFGINNNLVCKPDNSLYVFFFSGLKQLLLDCLFVYEGFDEQNGSIALYVREFVKYLPLNESNLSHLENMNIFTGSFSGETTKIYFGLLNLYTRLLEERVAEVVHDPNPIEHEEYLGELKIFLNLLSSQSTKLFHLS